MGRASRPDAHPSLLAEVTRAYSNAHGPKNPDQVVILWLYEFTRPFDETVEGPRGLSFPGRPDLEAAHWSERSLETVAAVVGRLCALGVLEVGGDPVTYVWRRPVTR